MKTNVLCSMVHGNELTRLSFHSVAQLLESYCTSKRGPQWDPISNFNSTVLRGLERMSDSPGPLNLDSYSGLNVSQEKLARVNTFLFSQMCLVRNAENKLYQEQSNLSMLPTVVWLYIRILTHK